MGQTDKGERINPHSTAENPFQYKPWHNVSQGLVASPGDYGKES
jgi:hypothetical protein